MAYLMFPSTIEILYILGQRRSARAEAVPGVGHLIGRRLPQESVQRQGAHRQSWQPARKHFELQRVADARLGPSRYSTLAVAPLPPEVH